jgi:metal-responsive CopG/Arc/MetJ family transcriptional regulator
MKVKPKTQKSKNKFLSVVLPVQLFDDLDRAAQKADRSKSKYVELLIRRHLEVLGEVTAVQQG